MAISNINKPMFTQDGKGDVITCPTCQKKVSMSIFENTNGPFDALVLGKSKTEHYAVCPLCADVFFVNPDYIYERNSGTTVYMTESDLIKREKRG